MLTPRVLDPDAVPVITDATSARQDPELAVLSAMAHANSSQGVDTALAAIAAAVGLDEERARLYHDLVLAALPAAARRALEERMASGTWEYQSDFAKKYVAIGEALGEARGEARGEAHEAARAVIAVLRARKVPMSAQTESRILACEDVQRLREWLLRAVTATTAEDVIVEA